MPRSHAWAGSGLDAVLGQIGEEPGQSKGATRRGATHAGHVTIPSSRGPAEALRIEDYALIGDMRTAALVGTDGAINWLPLPRFDSPAVFAALLGQRRHGFWVLAPQTGDACARRQYREDTLILETVWTTATGMVKVSDLMVPGASDPTVVRVVDGLVGSVAMHTGVEARMNYGRDAPTTQGDSHVVVLRAGEVSIRVAADVPLRCSDGACAADFVVAAGQRVAFTLSYLPDRRTTPACDASVAMAETDTFWTEWTSRTTYVGPWADDVNRSLRVLKALTYRPTGAIVAAATASLPERLGGSRNWDYRYSWLRDATFAAQAFLRSGHVEEVVSWRDWVVRTLLAHPGESPIMYAVDGTADLPEQTLDWLPGHAESGPVRVGNAAVFQQQNDVWGEVIDVLTAVRRAGVADLPGQREVEQGLLEKIERHWGDPDHGLWEVRGPRRHFVHSKLMAWVGVDRMVQALPDHDRTDGAGRSRLCALREEIARDLMNCGYDHEQRVFTQSYCSQRLDAAVLLMPAYGFLAWNDERMIRTVDAIQRELSDDGLVQRYVLSDDDDQCNVDGLAGTEGTFIATSFWLADALLGAGRTRESLELFERLLEIRNDVGLLSEEYDPVSGRHLGNTPQAFSHAGLVTTAIRLGADNVYASSALGASGSADRQAA